MPLRARSSADQSIWLRTRGSGVRISPGAHQLKCSFLGYSITALIPLPPVCSPRPSTKVTLRLDLPVFVLRTGTALSGGFFGIGGSFALLPAFALNEPNSFCLRSDCV